MNKNTIVGWVALIGIIAFVFVIVAAIGAAMDSPAIVTCNGSTYSVTCVRS